MEKLTKQEVIERVKYIFDVSGDGEVAHIYEDKLYYDFVDCLKNDLYKTKKEIVEVAIELAKVRGIDFARWHA